eukprot:5158157-Prymnesium_polylepis.1
MAAHVEAAKDDRFHVISSLLVRLRRDADERRVGVGHVDHVRFTRGRGVVGCAQHRMGAWRFGRGALHLLDWGSAPSYERRAAAKSRVVDDM